eukprot:Em0013g898a
MRGDYEFLTRMYGLSGARGCYPCLRSIATPLSSELELQQEHLKQSGLTISTKLHQRLTKEEASHNCITEHILISQIAELQAIYEKIMCK